nr:iron ABC transporter permease [Patulibacter sp. SYSU D01012]
MLVGRRATVATGALALVTLACVVGALVVGSSSIGVSDAVSALLGVGDRRADLLVWELRMPRVVAGLAAGGALGVAGLLTQTLADNRLATPDVLGVNQGAIVAIMVAVLGTDLAMLGAWWAGPIGAAAAAALVFAIAGGIGRHGLRLLVVGIALTTAMSSVIDVVLARQDLGLAGAVYTWTVGDLANGSVRSALPALIALAALAPALLVTARTLRLLRLGDATAAGLGVAVGRLHVRILLLAVVLAGTGVAVAGPVAFVALAAPVLAAGAVGPGRVPVVGAALVGAALVVAADTVGRVVAGPVEVPVGVVTSLLGGPFLLWVLLRQNRTEEVR